MPHLRPGYRFRHLARIEDFLGDEFGSKPTEMPVPPMCHAIRESDIDGSDGLSGGTWAVQLSADCHVHDEAARGVIRIPKVWPLQCVPRRFPPYAQRPRLMLRQLRRG
jgi:hypothetical protein